MTSSIFSFHLRSRADGVEPCLNALASLQQTSELAYLREGAHHAHMFQRLAIHHEVGHPEIHVGGQSAIEFDLSVAVRGSRFVHFVDSDESGS